MTVAFLRAGLYRAAREVISSALNHAGEAQIDASLRRTARGTEVAVRDDGCGLTGYAMSPGTGCRTGTGLDGMRRRADQIAAESAGGALASGGTRVRCVLPSQIPA